MPLNRPALSLGPGPRSLQDARRRVVQTCLDIGRPDLVECAELGVSELVSNALLHGAPPITVQVRGTAAHPRIEVSDASTTPPVILTSHHTDAGDDLLLTFGRGLTLVARASTAWGAEIGPEGKTVWFTPSCELSEGTEVEPVITGGSGPEPAPAPLEDPVEVTVLGIPLDLYLGFRRHFRELRRELRLLAIAHRDEYPLASTISDLVDTLYRRFGSAVTDYDLLEAMAGGVATTDLRVRIPRSTARPLHRFLDLLDLTDEFCRQHRLLALARDETQVVFQRWFLGEHIRQAYGAPPCPWDPRLTERLGAS